MTPDDTRPDVVETFARRPGHELGAARERAGVSLEEMAATLHLPTDQVRALEADEYSRLPPPAYVRGYLRAYAREVGMDADQVVADYDAVCGEVEDPELVIHPGVPDPVTGRGPVLALLLVLAVAVAGALAWWLQQSADFPLAVNGDDITEPAGTAEADAVQDDPALDAGEPDQGEAADFEPTAPETPESTAGEGSVDTTEPAAPTGAADDPAGDGALDPEGEAADGEEAIEDTATVAEDEVAAERMLAEGSGPRATSRAEEVATTAAAEGPDQLRIEVNGQSWLEIFDARGRQLAYTLYSGDEPVILNGWAPFDVMLGNSHDVTLYFGDLEIDHSAFVRSDSTSRFLVDGDGASRR